MGDRIGYLGSGFKTVHRVTGPDKDVANGGIGKAVCGRYVNLYGRGTPLGATQGTRCRSCFAPSQSAAPESPSTGGSRSDG